MDDLQKEDQDEFEESKFKKIYVAIIALFLGFLLIMNSMPGYHIISYLSGKIVSSDIVNDEIVLKSGKIIFENNVYTELKNFWLLNQKNEFKACLIGKRVNNNYVVSGLYVPQIYDQSVFSVTSAPCNEQTIISLHSHPPLRCIFSAQDIKSYEKFKLINPDAMIGLMCDIDRFSFYGYK